MAGSDLLLNVPLTLMAQAYAYDARHQHEYLPQTVDQAYQFIPHKWVLAAMAAAYNRGRDEQTNDSERNTA